MWHSKLENAGVPLGSALGSLLFMIYLNVFSELFLSMCRLFAYDLQYSSDNIAEIDCSINQDLYIHVYVMWSK